MRAVSLSAQSAYIGRVSNRSTLLRKLLRPERRTRNQPRVSRRNHRARPTPRCREFQPTRCRAIYTRTIAGHCDAVSWATTGLCRQRTLPAMQRNQRNVRQNRNQAASNSDTDPDSSQRCQDSNNVPTRTPPQRSSGTAEGEHRRLSQLLSAQDVSSRWRYHATDDRYIGFIRDDGIYLRP